MKIMNQTAVVLLSAVLTLMLPGCDEHDEEKPSPVVETGTFFGPDQPVGNGVGRTFVTLDHGVPTAMGLELHRGDPDLGAGSAIQCPGHLRLRPAASGERHALQAHRHVLLGCP